jgi:hypothetical protein
MLKQWTGTLFSMLSLFIKMADETFSEHEHFKSELIQEFVPKGARLLSG